MRKALALWILLLFILIAKASAQQKDDLSPNQIDSALSSKSVKNGKLDSLFTLEEFFKTYKKILGIKIRTSKGIIYEETVLWNKQLLYHGENWIVGYDTHRKVYHDYYNLYFISNKPAKYEELRLWPDKSGNQGLLRRKIILYIDKGKIIKTESNIKDGYKLNDKKLNKILNYTNYKQHLLIADTTYKK